MKILYNTEQKYTRQQTTVSDVHQDPTENFHICI